MVWYTGTPKKLWASEAEESMPRLPWSTWGLPCRLQRRDLGKPVTVLS